jgi:Domain of unknown function (DUF4412)
MRLVLCCFTLAATQALAGDFEGIITGRPIASEGQVQSMKMYLAPSGVRAEAGGNAGPKVGGSFQFVMVWKAADPNATYVLNPLSKTYMKHDLPKAKSATAAAGELPKVEKLGTASYLGHTVQKVKVTFSGSSGAKELWIDTSLRFPAAALALFGQEQGPQSSPWPALEKAGIVGIPLKELDADGKSGWEATSVEKKSLSASLFQVPADYTEAKNKMQMLSPAQQAAIQQQMQKLTPEQRAKAEEMMQQR